LITGGKVCCGDYSLVQNKDKTYSVIKESKAYTFRTKESARKYFKESIKDVTAALKATVNECINESINKVDESLNEDFVVMLPQGFE